MEALTAVSVAALTIYDMCKAVQKDIQITDIRLESEKHGSRISGRIQLPAKVKHLKHERRLLCSRSSGKRRTLV